MSVFVQNGNFLSSISRKIVENNNTWSATFSTSGFLMFYPNALRFVSDQPFTVYQNGSSWSSATAVTVQGQTMYTGGVTYSPSNIFTLDDTSGIFITNDALDSNTSIPDDIWYCMNHEAPTSGSGTATVEIDIEGERLTFESQSLGNTITRFIDDDAEVDMEE